MSKHNEFLKRIIKFYPVFLSLVLIACSESSNDGGITGTGSPVNADSPLETYLKQGMAYNNQNHYSCVDCLAEPSLEMDGGDASPTDSSDQLGSTNDDYSKTNTQETGVDELDWLKTDGSYIYSYNGGSEINVFALQEQTGKQSPLSTIPLDIERHNLQGLYLDENLGKQIIAVGNQYTYEYSSYFWYWSESKSQVDIYDRSNPSNIEKNATISIDGQYISSRKIGSKLYIISQYSAHIDNYLPHPYLEQDIAKNAELISKASLEDLLPDITINGQTHKLIEEKDCYIPKSPSDARQPTLAIVTEIDLTNTTEMSVNDIHTSCIAAPISTIYSSVNSVYMVEDEYQYDETGSSQQSHIYKLDYQDKGLAFLGKVSLPGKVGWNEQFRLSEHDGYLRVVTTEQANFRDFTHRLHTIKISDTGLSLSASIPNETAPEAIGKPGEAIYGVRFNAEKAYIVTFRQIDPFYVLDLSSPESPRVAGELELPGFSDYLHPFGEDLVFGLGRGSETGTGTNNIKLALFDVSEMSQPTLIDEVLVEGDRSYTPALYSHTALSILPAGEDAWRLGFSASIHENWQWQKDAYFLYEVHGKTHEGGASLTSKGELLGSDSASGLVSNYYYSYYDRGVLTPKHIHYSHNGHLITEEWDALNLK